MYVFRNVRIFYTLLIKICNSPYKPTVVETMALTNNTTFWVFVLTQLNLGLKILVCKECLLDLMKF